MATSPLSYKDSELKDARAAGFRRKKPKKPKSKTPLTIERYFDRYNSWVKDMKEKAKEGKKIRDMRDKLRKA